MPRVSGTVTNAPTALTSPTATGARNRRLHRKPAIAIISRRYCAGTPKGGCKPQHGVAVKLLRKIVGDGDPFKAVPRGHRPKGPNPATWSDVLEHVLPKPSKVAPVNHHAAPYGELPALMAQLKTREGVGVKALTFTITTAARSDETLGATWDEIDFGNAVWTVPAARAKSRREHRVPLAPPALPLLKHLYREATRTCSSARATKRWAMLPRARRCGLGCNATAHGICSAFSTWAHEQTAPSNHVIEMCLAHAVGSDVEKIDPRNDLFNKRRKLLEQWATYCCSPPAAAGAVLPMHKGAPA
jgi:integrase